MEESSGDQTVKKPPYNNDNEEETSFLNSTSKGFDIHRDDPPKYSLNYFLNLFIFLIVCILSVYKLILIDKSHLNGMTWQQIVLKIPKDNFQVYLAQFNKNPVRVKAMTSGTVYVIGDIISQMQTVGLGEINRLRILRSGLAGLLLHGPMSHLWYIKCDMVFEKFKITQWWNVFPKVAIDQLLWGPFWNATYIIFIGILQLHKPRDIAHEVYSTWIPLMTKSMSLWIPTHLITYGLVPQNYRLLWVDFVEIFWCFILATSASGASKRTKMERSDREKKKMLNFFKQKGIERRISDKEYIRLCAEYFGKTATELEIARIVDRLETPCQYSDFVDQLFASTHLNSIKK